MKTSTVQEKFNQAPEKIQDIVMSVETSETLYEIEKKYEVYKEENGLRVLPKETARVLIGITHPKDFVPELVEKLDIPKEKAQEVAREVNQKIFSQVKDLLIEIHGLSPTPSETPGSAPDPEKSPPDGGSLRAGSDIPTPPPASPYKSQGGAVPQKKEDATPMSSPVPQAPQKSKNPFEEKLRQTFTIPKKDSPIKTPLKKDNLEEMEIRQLAEKKKEDVRKDPYLETPE